MDHGKVGWEGVDWKHLAQDNGRVARCEHGNKLSGSIRGGKFLD